MKDNEIRRKIFNIATDVFRFIVGTMKPG